MPAIEGFGSGVNIASKEKFAKVKHLGRSMLVSCASLVGGGFSTLRNLTGLYSPATLTYIGTLHGPSL
jgi:hypothetical protein